MRTAQEIYGWLRHAPRRAEAVGILSDAELLRVSGWLARDYNENSDSGELLGICLVERSDRWARTLMTTTTGGDEG